jgi:hypothetical protein
LAENQAGRIAELQKSKKQLESAGPAPAPVVVPPPPPSDLNKSDLKELKALREEVLRLRAGVKEQDQKSKLPQSRVGDKADGTSCPAGEGVQGRSRTVADITTRLYTRRAEFGGIHIRSASNGRIGEGRSLPLVL